MLLASNFRHQGLKLTLYLQNIGTSYFYQFIDLLLSVNSHWLFHYFFSHFFNRHSLFCFAFPLLSFLESLILLLLSVCCLKRFSYVVNYSTGIDFDGWILQFRDICTVLFQNQSGGDAYRIYRFISVCFAWWLSQSLPMSSFFKHNFTHQIHSFQKMPRQLTCLQKDMETIQISIIWC